VASHARALLATEPSICAAEADITRPGEVLAHPAVQAAIDWAEPVCVVLAAILHFRDTAAARRLVAAYADRASRGSWLAVSVFGGRDDDMEVRSRAAYTAARFWVHGIADVARWLDGLEVVPPGICEARRWKSGVGGTPSRGGWALCALAVKPDPNDGNPA
jgi:hypothetical protein